MQLSTWIEIGSMIGIQRRVQGPVDEDFVMFFCPRRYLAVSVIPRINQTSDLKIVDSALLSFLTQGVIQSAQLTVRPGSISLAGDHYLTCEALVPLSFAIV